MKLLVVASVGAPDQRLAEIRDRWGGRGHQDEVHRLDGPVEYGELLDVVLEAQADTVLLAGMAGDDALVESVVDVVWKFDNACRVVLDGPATTVDGVTPATGPAGSIVDALCGRVEPDRPSGGPSGIGPLLVSRGWAKVPARYLSAAGAAEIGAAIDACDRDGSTIVDASGYRRAVGVPAHSASLLTLLDDPRLGALVASAIGSAEMWLGALEGLVPGPDPGWRRELAGPLLQVAGAAFRPGLSMLVALDAGGGQVDVQPGSHRLRTEPIAEPAHVDRLPLAQGAAALVEGGCRFRLSAGRFVHLRFIRGWMKPDVLLAGPLRDRRLGAQARRWCGMDIGLPTSVEEFLSIEEAALTGGLAQRKGSGI